MKIELIRVGGKVIILDGSGKISNVVVWNPPGPDEPNDMPKDLQRAIAIALDYI